MTQSEISAKTGFDLGDTFQNDAQVRAYFQHDEQVRMFGDEALEQDELDRMASLVIREHWHYADTKPFVPDEWGAGVKAVAAQMGATTVRVYGEGGEGEDYTIFFRLDSPTTYVNGATTNAYPVWEDEDEEAYAKLAALRLVAVPGVPWIFRAAWVSDQLLTAPEHGRLSDEELLAEAVREAVHAGLLEDGETEEHFHGRVEIGDYYVPANEIGSVYQPE